MTDKKTNITERIAFSIEEAAKMIGVSKGHLRNENQRGKLRFIKSGKRILITNEDLRSYLQVNILNEILEVKYEKEN